MMNFQNLATHTKSSQVRLQLPAVRGAKLTIKIYENA